MPHAPHPPVASPVLNAVKEPAASETRRPARRPVASPVPSGAKGPARRCTHTTAAGEPCRAWAIRDSDPPTCSAHAGRTRGAGAPSRNQNARKHGFYARTLSPDEIADLLADADLNLKAEIACARVALRRVLEFLSNDPSQLSSADQIRACGLVFQGTRTVSRLLRDLHALGGDIDRFDEITGQVLDDLGREWGIDL